MKIFKHSLSIVTMLFCLLCISVSAFASDSVALVNASVTNMYEKADANSPVVSQAIYATPVKILNKQHGFALVQTADSYQGWVNEHELVFRSILANARMAKVKNLFANIFQDASISNHQPMLTVPFGTMLPLVKIASEDWLAVQLADGKTGWVQAADFTIDPQPMSMTDMLALSHIFVGIPYLWGGVSSYGFDCSGFVQMLYKQIGVFLPRDTNIQVYWPGFKEVTKEELQPGDILYLGFDKKVSHTGVYLGNHLFVNATTEGKPMVQVSDVRLPHWQKLYIIARRVDNVAPPQFQGSIETVPADVSQKMQQYSWRPGCPVSIENLAYLKMSYWGFDNKPHLGTMIVGKDVAQEVLAIFKELYEQKYPIEKMQPIDAYHGNDTASMVDNNTSAFNCRAMTDFPDQYSVHSYGRAIDINPLINPYVNNGKVEPNEGAPYADRAVYHKGKILMNSAVYNVFTKYGWVWGGSWYGPIKDFQHFEKPLPKK